MILSLILFLFMLGVLYWAGKGLQRNGVKIFSKYGIAAILVYTLNEGLRFGRGIDYNAYWKLYDNFDSVSNIGFDALSSLLISLHLPWQACVIAMSFMFILGTLFVMKIYRNALPIALPIWAVLSCETVETLMRWNLAFSFIMIGMYYLIQESDYSIEKFIIFSVIGATFHYAIAPIPILFYLIYKLDKPIASPFVVISIFVLLHFLFKTSWMLEFVPFFKSLSSLATRFEVYGENAQYWLVKSVRNTSFSIGVVDTILGVFVTIMGRYGIKQSDKKYIFAYNLFLISFMFRPVAIDIELLSRYDELPFYFRAVCFGYIASFHANNNIRKASITYACVLFLTFIAVANPARHIITDNPNMHLYIWDKGDKTPEYMLNEYVKQRVQKK